MHRAEDGEGKRSVKGKGKGGKSATANTRKKKKKATKKKSSEEFLGDNVGRQVI